MTVRGASTPNDNYHYPRYTSDSLEVIGNKDVKWPVHIVPHGKGDGIFIPFPTDADIAESEVRDNNPQGLSNQTFGVQNGNEFFISYFERILQNCLLY